jgi:DNA gyrase/topoisomerase IV subunit A
VRTIPTDKRNGLVIGLVQVSEHSNILLVDEAGKMIRLSPAEIRTMGRQAKGVRLIRLDADQKLASVFAFEEEEHGDADSSTGSGDSGIVVEGAKKLDAFDAPYEPEQIIFASQYAATIMYDVDTNGVDTMSVPNDDELQS